MWSCMGMKHRLKGWGFGNTDMEEERIKLLTEWITKKF